MSPDLCRQWLEVPPKGQPPNHYQLLGIDLFEADPHVITIAANRQMALLQRRAASQRVALPQQLLNEIATARQCLLDAETGAKYDADLRQRLSEIPPAASEFGGGAEGVEGTVDAPPSTALPAAITPIRSGRIQPWHFAAVVGVILLSLVAAWAIVSLRGRSLHVEDSAAVSTQAPAPSKTDGPVEPPPILPSIRLSVSDLAEWGVYFSKAPLAELVEYDEANDCARFLQRAAIYNMRLAKYDRYIATFQYRRTNWAWGSIWLQDYCKLRLQSIDGAGTLYAPDERIFTPLAGQKVLDGEDEGEKLVRVLPMEKAEKEAGQWNDVRLERDLKRWTITINGRIVQKVDCNFSEHRPFTMHAIVGFEFKSVEVTPLR